MKRLQSSEPLHAKMNPTSCLFRVRSHAPSIRSHRGTKVVWPDIQPMRVSKEPVCIDLFRQKPVFTSLHLKYPVHVVQPLITVFCIESCLTIGWRNFIWWKNPPKCCSIFSILVWIQGFLYPWAVNQRTIDVSPTFLEHRLAEKIVVSAHANGDLNKQEVGFIFHEAALNFELLWNIQDQK